MDEALAQLLPFMLKVPALFVLLVGLFGFLDALGSLAPQQQMVVMLLGQLLLVAFPHAPALLMRDLGLLWMTMQHAIVSLVLRPRVPMGQVERRVWGVIDKTFTTVEALFWVGLCFLLPIVLVRLLLDGLLWLFSVDLAAHTEQSEAILWVASSTIVSVTAVVGCVVAFRWVDAREKRHLSDPAVVAGMICALDLGNDRSAPPANPKGVAGAMDVKKTGP